MEEKPPAHSLEARESRGVQGSTGNPSMACGVREEAGAPRGLELILQAMGRHAAF